MADEVDLTKPLPRGAIPSPRSELAAAMPHIPDPKVALPPSFLMWPIQMSSWNNYTYGDCVTAEEAFAKATAAPQIFIPLATAVSWATAHGYLNGAVLSTVLTTMQTKGFPLNNKTYDDGPHLSVNWTVPATLESAIFSHGPVKLGVAAEHYQSAAPGQHGIVTPGQAVGQCTATRRRPPHRKITARAFAGTGPWHNWLLYLHSIKSPSIRWMGCPQASAMRCSPGTPSASSMRSRC
jgi:hypothetical protein